VPVAQSYRKWKREPTPPRAFAEISYKINLRSTQADDAKAVQYHSRSAADTHSTTAPNTLL
jgi:hypothetical protein